MPPHSDSDPATQSVSQPEASSVSEPEASSVAGSVTRSLGASAAVSREQAAPSARERKQAERRGRVIEAAMMLARDGGYDAVHMRDVSAKADVAMGTIYRYFSSKDELLSASLVTWIKILRNRLSQRVPRGDTPAERLADTLASASRVSDRAMPLMKALITAMSSTDPAVVVHRHEVNKLMHEIIANGMRDVPPEVDVEGVSRVINHVWSSSINQWVSGMTPNGSVADELRNAAYLLLGQYE